jgi:hypothetical protein
LFDQAPWLTLGRVKYCTNPTCPHRLRIRSLAEFLDSVVVCSDCGTLLVAADSPEQLKDIAEQGREGPYRRPGNGLMDIREEDSARSRATKNAGVGASIVIGGVLLAAPLLGRGGGDITVGGIVTTLMILYGVARLIGVGMSSIRADAMRSSKVKARRGKARKAKARGVDSRVQ